MTQYCETLKFLCSSYTTGDINDIIHEDIDSRYGYGKLCNSDVIIMKKNGYVNVTNFCEDNGNDFDDWFADENSQRLITELESMIDDPAYIVSKKGNSTTRGIYVHPKLIIPIIMSCSAKYALQVSKIVLGHHVKEAIDKKNRKLGKQSSKNNKL